MTTPNPVTLTPKDLSPYRAYLKGRILTALSLQGNEQCDMKGVHLAVQADCLAAHLSEEASIALTIGVTQSSSEPVLSKAIIETMVAACMEKASKEPKTPGTKPLTPASKTATARVGGLPAGSQPAAPVAKRGRPAKSVTTPAV